MYEMVTVVVLALIAQLGDLAALTLRLRWQAIREQRRQQALATSADSRTHVHGEV